uniref:Uncharacterized protein n=1 Tax=Anopheles melas TaxID=34690 RepID=A0A182UDG0_9DIPT
MELSCCVSLPVSCIEGLSSFGRRFSWGDVLCVMLLGARMADTGSPSSGVTAVPAVVPVAAPPGTPGSRWADGNSDELNSTFVPGRNETLWDELRLGLPLPIAMMISIRMSSGTKMAVVLLPAAPSIFSLYTSQWVPENSGRQTHTSSLLGAPGPASASLQNPPFWHGQTRGAGRGRSAAGERKKKQR